MRETEILGPLKESNKTKVLYTHPRHVFMLTDGIVSNTDEIIDFIS